MATDSPAERAARATLDHRLRETRAVIFDTDGVLVDSAGLHAAAWQDAFDAALRAHPPPDPARRRPFDPEGEYRRYVDGRPRLEGTRCFLTHRGLRLPEGSAEDAPGTDTVRAVAARKEERFVAALRRTPVRAWPGTSRLLDRLRRAGVHCAAVSASRHAAELLDGADLGGRFELLIDGAEAARVGLAGKPDPALFLTAARRLEVPVTAATVVEDATAGVEAARRGGFGLVVGVRRAGGGQASARLLDHGADLVVGDLAELIDEPSGVRRDTPAGRRAGKE